MKRTNNLMLREQFPDSVRLAKLLVALQLLGWIDFCRSEEEFYYRVRSS
jgi:hypothetical protein